MKRKNLERHLRRHGCYFHHHGGNHDVWLNPVTRAESTLGRHREIPIGTAKAICKQLRIPPPSKQ
jgi:mRNA interferase HicA